MHTAPSALVRSEAAALLALADRLETSMAEPFEQAVALILECGAQRGRVVLTGMGKSGLIARKIAATLSSTGSPALFLHPSEAVHGDIGMLAPGDVVLALSASGETEELLRLLATLQRVGDALITFTCARASTLARASDVALDCSVPASALTAAGNPADAPGTRPSGASDSTPPDPHPDVSACALAPTVSTTTMLALGDALSLAVSLRKGFRAEDFARLHPGGRLGKQLAPVRDLMHAGARIPSVPPDAPLRRVMDEMTAKALGMTVILDEQGILAGVLTDGDLRRLLLVHGPAALSFTAGQIMHKHPHTIHPDALAPRALAQMEHHRITALIVPDEHGRVLGILHLHALWGLGLV